MQRASAPVESPPPGIFGRITWMLLLVYVLLFFARPQDVYGFAFPGLLKLIALPMIGSWVLAVAVEGARPRLDFPQVRLVLVLIGLMLVSLPFAYITMKAYGTLTYLVQSVFLLLVIASTVVRRREQYRTLVHWFAFAGAWLAAEGVHFYVLPGGGRWRGSFAGSFLDDTNDFALFMCSALPFVVYCGITTERLLFRVFWWGSALAGVGAIVYTYSRGGMVTLVGMAIYGLFRMNGRRFRVLASVAFVGLCLYLVLPSSYWEGFRGITPQVGYRGEVEFEDSSAAARYEAWRAGLKMARDHPFVGVGPGSFQSAHWEFYRRPGVAGYPQPHSMYIQLLSELGVPGLLWSFALILVNLRATREARRRAAAAQDRDAALFAQALELGFVGFIVGAAFLSVAYYPTVYWLSWFIGMHLRLGPAPAVEAPLAPRRRYGLARA